jgi:predicted transcriptional regulator
VGLSIPVTEMIVGWHRSENEKGQGSAMSHQFRADRVDSDRPAAYRRQGTDQQEPALAINHETLLTLTTDIVTAHLANNPVTQDMVGKLVQDVFAALQAAGAPVEAIDPVKSAKPVGAVSVRASLKPDRLISMIDGKPYRMLKRHLALHGYTPQSYRAAFGLAADYPMVAAEYAERRRELAHQIGLGRKPKAVEAKGVVDEEAKPARKRRAKKAAPAPDAASDAAD